MNLKTYFCLSLTSLTCLINVSCNTKKGNTNYDSHVAASDSVKFLKVADASAFLPSWSSDNTLIYQWIAEPDMLHPANGISSQRNEILLYTQQFLVTVDFRTLKLVSQLAVALPQVSGDGLRVTFTLRKEPVWDNGQPLSVDDVIFTAKAQKCPFTDNPNYKPYWNNLKTIEKDSINPQKFTAIMKEPYMHNVAFWGDYPIMQRTFYDPENLLSKFSFEELDNLKTDAVKQKALQQWANNFNDEKYGRDPQFLTGLGPYKISSWEAGQTLTLERKENYWARGSENLFETCYPAKIIFKVNRDANSQMLEFKSQADDASSTLGTKTLLDLQTDSSFNANYHSQFVDTYFYTYAGMNTRPDGIKHKKIFTDKNVRRAIALLFPVDEINKIVNHGMNKRVCSPVSFLKPDYNRSLKIIVNDKEMAATLLAAAGWKDTDNDNVLDKTIDGEKIKFEFNLNYLTTQAEWKDMATMIADALYNAGIKVNLNPLDYPVFIGNARAHDFDMMLASWGQSALPEDFTQVWHTESWTTNGSNFTGFGNAQTDALIDSVKKTMNDDVRNELSKKFQQAVHDEQPMVFLFASLRRTVVHKRFGNVEMYFERPGLLLNNCRLLSVTSSSVSATQ